MSDDWLAKLFVGALVAVVTFFLKRHISSVDKKIDTLTFQSQEASTKLADIESNLGAVHRDVLIRISEIKIPKPVDHAKVENINVNVAIVRTQINNDIVPRLRKIEEDYGRVIILENAVKQESEKLRTLYKTIDLVFTKQGFIKKKPE